MDILLTESGPTTHHLKVSLHGKTILDRQISSSIDYQELANIEISCARAMALGTDRSISVTSVGTATYNATIDPINGFIYVAEEGRFNELFMKAQQMLVRPDALDPYLESVEGMAEYETDAMRFIEEASESAKGEEKRQNEAKMDFEEMTKTKESQLMQAATVPTMHELAMSKVKMLREASSKRKRRG